MNNNKRYEYYKTSSSKDEYHVHKKWINETRINNHFLQYKETILNLIIMIIIEV